eukprot:tig00000792_g4208.t1
MAFRKMNGHIKTMKVLPNPALKNVKYEIRGPLNRRADELAQQGAQIIKLNIGNPGAFGFRTPELLRQAVVDHLEDSEGYVHQKGVLSARKAIVDTFTERGIPGVTPDHVFIGNGVSELIMMAMRALICRFDEVMVPSPDYPLWTASVVMHDGTPVHYPCKVENGFLPKVEDLEALVTPRTRAIVVISPNNPTGVVYPEETLKMIADFAERHNLVLFSDEIYDHMLYDGAQHISIGRFVKKTLCATFGGLSKVYRACGFRVGWLVFSGNVAAGADYFMALDLLAGLRLCSNAPGQWAVETALRGHQTIHELTNPGGRLYQTRKAIIEGVKKSKYLRLAQIPDGAMYVFIGVNKELLPDFDDQKFGMDLLEQKHVLIAPGTSFNVKYNDHFRLTLLPNEETVADVFHRIGDVLDGYAKEYEKRRAEMLDSPSRRMSPLSA